MTKPEHHHRTQDENPSRAPDPAAWTGALFYAVTGGLIAAVILAALHHVHLVWR